MSKTVKMNFAQSLIAVLAGNIVYFLLMPYLPPAAQHVHKYDLGMVVDFAFCLVFLGVIKTISKWGSRSREHQR